MNTTFSKRPYLKMVEILNETIPFIVAQKLWKGFLQQKTVLYLTIFLGLTVPITLFNYFGKKIENIDENETVEMGLGSINLGDATSIFGGYHKYVVMMLFAMFITYFMYKTLDV
ncbi:MAG TPA: hypothetical protein PKD85_20560, partial [Saprospiraceae bacterium]|nr:hypothetical protein [Saprospiraceae bacterium]